MLESYVTGSSIKTNFGLQNLIISIFNQFLSDSRRPLISSALSEQAGDLKYFNHDQTQREACYSDWELISHEEDSLIAVRIFELRLV